MGGVILSSYAEPQYALRVFESGSEGRAHLLKDRIRNRAELVGAIEAVARGCLHRRSEGSRDRWSPPGGAKLRSSSSSDSPTHPMRRRSAQG